MGWACVLPHFAAKTNGAAQGQRLGGVICAVPVTPDDGGLFSLTGSIDVAAVALVGLHLGDVGGGFFGGFAAVGLDELMQGFIDIDGHA